MLLAPLLLVLFFLPRLFDWLHTFGGNILSPLRVLAGVFSMRRWAWDWIERGFWMVGLDSGVLDSFGGN